MSSDYEIKILNEEYEFVQKLLRKREYYKKEEIRLVLEEKDENHRKSIIALIYILSKMYMRADWNKIGKNSYRDNVFQHKIRAGASESTPREIVEVIANSLGLQSISVISEVFNVLMEDSDYIKYQLRTPGGGIYFSRMAMELSKNIREWNIEKKLIREKEKKEKKKKQQVLEIEKIQENNNLKNKTQIEEDNNE